MFTHAWHRLRRRRLLRHPAFRVVLLLLLVWDSLHVLTIYNNQHEALAARESIVSNYHRGRAPWTGTGTQPHEEKDSSSKPSTPAPAPKLFIASQHWNSAHLLRDRWNAALVSLVHTLGPENVYVSIYESGSYDDTKAALRELDDALEALGVRRSIVLEQRSHEDEINSAPAKEEERQPGGWVRIPKGSVGGGEWGRRRIPFLAELRNRVLEPLRNEFGEGRRWEKVLFLNDVVFTPADVLTLLATNHNDYAAACALDFAHPPYYYDTFALRDSQGHETVSQVWPYFRSRASRRAVERFDAVPVASCWNGMVVMNAKPFVGEYSVGSQNGSKELRREDDEEGGGGGTKASPPPLRFRAIPDSLAAHHVEASECCLIHADNEQSRQRGVWLNPNVRVAYSSSAYDEVNAEGNVIMGPARIWMRVWANRVRRWATWVVVKEGVVRWRVRVWKQEGEGVRDGKAEKREERGVFCLINEMQILQANGWRHV